MKTAEKTACYDPATGEVIGWSEKHDLKDLQAAMKRARHAQPAWAATPVRARARAIFRVRDHIVAHADELAETIAKDNGKTRVDAMAAEVLPSAMAATYYARHARRFLRARRLCPGNLLLANKTSKIVRVPFGVIAVISPWNYPFAIPFSEVVMGLLAGNAVILKTASQTQLVGRALEECIRAGGLPEGVFQFLNLPGAVAGDALLEAGIDKLFFTGSVPVGKKLMAKAAERLTPVSLELGGNDAMLVCADADVERAAGGAVWAGLQNCGQSCGGVERIYVHQAIYEPFLERLAQKVRALRVGRDVDHNVDLGVMTTGGQARIVKEHVRDAVEKGAVIYAQSDIPADAGENCLPATILTNVDHTMTVMREETFGPVLGVMRVGNMDAAVEFANDSLLGLTGSVWSGDTRRAERIARKIRAGVVMINDHLMSHGLAETPWGGFGESGIGRTHGEIGFAEMTEPQCIVHDILPWVKRNMWWHPHGPRVYQGLRGLLEFLYAPGISRRRVGLQHLLRLLPRMFRNEESP